MNNRRRSLRHTTPSENNLTKMVTVTLKSHALFGQKFEFVRLRGKEPLVVIRLPGGKTARLPMDYTDYGLPQPFGAVASGEMGEPILLDIKSLLRVTGFVAHIKKRLPPNG